MENTVRKMLIEVNDSVSLIEETLQGIGYEDFRNDRFKKIIVVENFEKIIDKFAQIPDELQDEIHGIPWEEIQHLSDKFLNSEYEIDNQEVWKTAKSQLKKIKTLISSFI